LHKPLSPQGIHPLFPNYSKGLELVARTRLVFSPAQGGFSPEGEIPADFAGQAALCFDNIDAILREAGMDRRHVVKLNAYVTAREYLKPYMEARNARFEEPWPASTLVIVTGFAREDFLVEVEAVAAAPV